MKILYKNKMLERVLIGLSGAGITSVMATFVLLYGFAEPVLSPVLLHSVQVAVFALFLAQKFIRLFNAESKMEFLRFHWLEIPLLGILLIVALGAGRWFAVADRKMAMLIAIDVYLVLQVLSKLCRSMVQMASTGQNPARALTGTFIILICFGAGMLLLPKSYDTGADIKEMTFTDAVFTATSATCVTGLIVRDTGDDFTMLGQAVILTLIQLGGLGIVIFGAVMALLLGQALSVRESAAMQDLLNAQTLSRIGKMIAFILLVTILIEAAGTLALTPMWDDVPGQYDSGQHMWFCSVFHSISAFCNAGFSLFDRSLIDYHSSVGVYAVIAPLIILGGLGFGVLYNLTGTFWSSMSNWVRRKTHPSAVFDFRQRQRLSLQTKIVLSVSAILIVTGILLMMLLERSAGEAMDFKAALFQSITARTAGFNTVDIASMSDASKFILIILMFIGGSPGSTAGGIKTVTFAVIVMIAWSSFRKRRDVEIFGRSVRLLVVGRAVTVALLFAGVLLAVTFLLTITERNNAGIYGRAEGSAFMDILFEAASALGTVGLSTGITPSLTTAGKWIIIITMLIGRLGPLTLLMGLTHEIKPLEYDYPSEPLVVG